MIILHTQLRTYAYYVCKKWIITFKNKILDAAKLQRRMANPSKCYVDPAQLDLLINQFNTSRPRTRNAAGSLSYRVVPLLLWDSLKISLRSALAQYCLAPMELAHDNVSTVENAIVVHIQSTECVECRPDVLLRYPAQPNQHGQGKHLTSTLIETIGTSCR